MTPKSGGLNVFQSKYLEQQQPKIKNKLQNLIGEGKQVPIAEADGFPYQ